jgi:hypothetical protein
MVGHVSYQRKYQQEGARMNHYDERNYEEENWQRQDVEQMYEAERQAELAEQTARIEPTIVIFRRWPNGRIIALFPYMPRHWNEDEDLSMSYEHGVHHGWANVASVVRRTTPANPAEIASLRKELEGEPYQYKLIRVDRTPRDAAEIRDIRRSQPPIRNPDACNCGASLAFSGGMGSAHLDWCASMR